MDVSLIESTGSEEIDEILRGVVGVHEMLFPGRIRGYYVTGSHAYGEAVAASDIDGAILFKDRFSSGEEREAAQQVARCCGQMIPYEYDVLPEDEGRFLRLGAVDIKLNSLLVYGEDVRERMPLPPIEIYARLMMHAPLRFLARIRGNPPYLTYPLRYPDPEDAFYGYTGRQVRGPNGALQPGTKELVNCVDKPALALATQAAQTHIVNKPDCLAKYRSCVADEWTDLIEEIHAVCRREWAYRAPEDEVGRARLRQFCARTLAFENYFLDRYRDFLLEDVQTDGESHWLAISDAVELLGFSRERLQQAVDEGSMPFKVEHGEVYVSGDQLVTITSVQMMGQIIYPKDETILAALQGLSASKNSYLRKTAEEVLQIIQQTQRQ